MRQLTTALTLAAAALYFVLAPSSNSTPMRSPSVEDMASAGPAAVSSNRSKEKASKTMKQQPSYFIPNQGQWAHETRYAARFGAMTMFLEDQGWTFTLAAAPNRKPESTHPEPSTPSVEADLRLADHRLAAHETHGVAVRMTFNGTGAKELSPDQRTTAVHHYFIGNDPSNWRSNVPLYSTVRYQEIQPGVDVLARQQDGHFEYDLILRPEALLERVEITVEGIEGMHINDTGGLVLDTALGPVCMGAPPSWEEGPEGEKSPIVCRYVLLGGNRFGFESPQRRSGWSLVVDPGIVWSTFLGGSGTDYISALDIDAQGSVTVTGHTGSLSTFPTTPGAYRTTTNGPSDVFVSKLSSSGSSLVYSSFFGGSGDDYVREIDVSAQGTVTFAGNTRSNNFPVTANAISKVSKGGWTEAFVAQLSSTGSTLLYSTLIGGSDYDYINGLVVDAQGVITIAGSTKSTDFPVTFGGIKWTNSGGYDAFIARLSPATTRLHLSTYLGGQGDDFASGLALDAQGGAIVAGTTNSPDFPTTAGAFDTTFAGQDGYVARLSPLGTSLVFSTYLGGSGKENIYAMDLDAQGVTTVTGATQSTDFPTTSGAHDRTHNGDQDPFVTQISPTGSSLIYSTYLGGPSKDYGVGVVVDTRGSVTVAGTVKSSGYPTTPGAYDTTPWGLTDVFVSRLSPSGADLIYSTYLGGQFEDYPSALVLDAKGGVTVVGTTLSASFPTTPGALDTTYDAWNEGFITRLDMLPTGVTAFGSSSAGCEGPLASSVTSMPQVGNASFSLSCSNAPSNAVGGVLVGSARLTSPLKLLGIEVLVDPYGSFFGVDSLNSNQVGAAEIALPIPQSPAIKGLQLFTQFVWVGPSAPLPCPAFGLSASNGLSITVQ